MSQAAALKAAAAAFTSIADALENGGENVKGLTFALAWEDDDNDDIIHHMEVSVGVFETEFEEVTDDAGADDEDAQAD